MSRSVAQVFDDALALDEDDRARLAAKLMESLEGDDDADRSEAWRTEIERRLSAVAAAEAKLVPADEAIARLRAAARR